MLHEQSNLGEILHLDRGLQDLRNHLTPLAEAMQRILQYLPESHLALRGQPKRSAFQTATGNTTQLYLVVLYSVSL